MHLKYAQHVRTWSKIYSLKFIFVFKNIFSDTGLSNYTTRLVYDVTKGNRYFLFCYQSY